MPRARPITTSFNGGELSPLLEGRVDLDKYFTGCRTLLNFIPTVQGPIRRRGGTRFVGGTKDNSQRSWLADFVFSAGQAYILEFGNGYLRFWVNRGQLLNGAVPYEIASPYSAAGLVTREGTFALRTTQSGDVMWIVHAEGLYPPYILRRFGATSWTLTQMDFYDGPFRALNTTAGALRASGETGTVLVTADGPSYFPPTLIGSLLKLESSALNQSYQVYQPYANIVTGNRVRNGGNVYEAVGNYTYTQGSQVQRYPPVHTEGAAFDGAVNWVYLHSGYGWGRILSVSGDGQTCTMQVIQQLPQEVVSPNATFRWAYSEFSAQFGWPTGVSFYRERLTFCRGRQVTHSVVGDFSSFKTEDAGVVTSETAMSLTLSADKLDGIRWLAQSRTLIIGTALSELSLGEQTQQQVYSPTNVQSVPQSEYGTRQLRPLRAGDSVLFVERAGQRVRDMKFDFTIDRYRADDLTVLSEHIFDGTEREGSADRGQRNIIDWAYQQQRDNIVWCVLDDGNIAAMTFNRERGVISWSQHSLGGGAVVESVQCIPSPDYSSDDVWFIVRRTINGQTRRYVEYLTDYRLVKKGLAEAVHVDCGATYRGAATSTVTGLTHLEGQTVSICVDGSNHPDRVVSGGQIALDRTGTLIHVGLRYASRMQSMRLEVQGGVGTAQTARKGIADLWFRFMSTVGGRYGRNFDVMDQIRTLDPKSPVGEPPKMINGDIKLQFPGGFDTDGFACYEQVDPHPATIVAMVSRVQIND